MEREKNIVFIEYHQKGRILTGMRTLKRENSDKIIGSWEELMQLPEKSHR
jgi:hypothetical protein